MKTYVDCIPCFFKQAVQAGRMSGLKDESIHELLISMGKQIESFSLDATPPEMAVIIHQYLQNKIDLKDPYYKGKRSCNKLMLSHYDKLKDVITQSKDPLLTGVKLAILGNMMDYGALNPEDIEDELFARLEQENKTLEHEPEQFFEYRKFRKALSNASRLLYLGDNAGEIVFDRLLIEEIKKNYPELAIRFSVRSEPVLNDVLLEDAKEIGIDHVAKVIENGSSAPATLLYDCSQDFQGVFWNSDLIISKGQGNYESLSTVSAPIYFFFISKCPVTARDVGCRQGDILLLAQEDL